MIRFSSKGNKRSQNIIELTYLTTHNWQKWKGTFKTCPSHEIHREKAVGLKNWNYTLQKYDLCVQFEAISLKFDILSIIA